MNANVVASILSLVFSTSLLGVTQYKEEVIPFITNPNNLRASIHISALDSVEKVKIPIRKLKKRILKSEKNIEVEPVNLWIKKDAKSISEFASLIGLPGKSLKLHSEIIKRVENQKENSNGNVKFTVTKKDLRLINLKKVATLLAKPHHDVSIDSETITTNKELTKELYKQTKFFLTKKQRRRLKRKLINNREVSLGKDLLPPFARKRLKKYLIYRGPNCFHAALSFQDEKMTKSHRINIKEEKGYHSAMINYDELWRAINSYFYEVDVNKAKLKYGDLVVFFNIPPNATKETNFRWIRHTATYLFDDYTFSKGSKSPNSPYTIKTLSDEWKTWQTYSSNLGVKIYRRNKATLQKSPPVDTTDWIY